MRAEGKVVVEAAAAAAFVVSIREVGNKVRFDENSPSLSPAHAHT